MGNSDDIAARVAALPEAVNRDAALLRRGRTATAACLLEVGGDQYLLRIAEGRVVDTRRGPFVTPSADFAIVAEPAVWRRLLAPEPPPGDHDIFAFLKRGELRLVGDLHPFMAHLLYFKGVIACLKERAR